MCRNTVFKHRSRPRQSGLTYIAVLLFVAILAALSAGTLRLGQTLQRHHSEQELLERGWELTQALESYQRATVAGQSPYPRRLEDLLRDPRFPKKAIRHLRRLDVDPITGMAEWGVVMSEDGSGIAGFHSLATQKPHRQELASPFADFSDSQSYRDWVFVAGLGG
jgi:type II secretory pathway pseudopilin PulG